DRSRPDRARFRDDAAPQSQAGCALSGSDRGRRGDADRVPAAVRLRPGRHPRGRAGGARRRPGGVRRLRRPRDPGPRHHRRRPGDGDRRRDGHDRGDHRPLPHHVHHPGVGAHRARRRCGDPDDGRAGARPRRRPPRGVPARRERRRVARGARRAGHDRLRAVLAVGGDGAGDEDGGGGQQPPDAAHAPAVLRQRLRAGRVDAGRPALVRREPAVHADHRDDARAAHRDGDRLQRTAGDGVVHRHRPGRLPVGAPQLRAPSRPL
ncbi:MAG: Efflux ABC transporter, permease protein, partial [uncultured Blastococcus sp.]